MRSTAARVSLSLRSFCVVQADDGLVVVDVRRGDGSQAAFHTVYGQLAEGFGAALPSFATAAPQPPPLRVSDSVADEPLMV
jgi:hypothetical protein